MPPTPRSFSRDDTLPETLFEDVSGMARACSKVTCGPIRVAYSQGHNIECIRTAQTCINIGNISFRLFPKLYPKRNTSGVVSTQTRCVVSDIPPTYIRLIHCHQGPRTVYHSLPKETGYQTAKMMFNICPKSPDGMH